MSSRFVSGGTIDAATGETSSGAPQPPATSNEKARQLGTTAPAAGSPSKSDLAEQHARSPNIEETADTSPRATNLSRPREKVTWGGETTGTPKEEARSTSTTTNLNPEWAAVQAELEEQRRRRAEERERAAKGEEKSLYEILQANKAAKQAAFEEAAKLKNQFRPLDDDEVDFLDEVAAKKREEEERVKKETDEGLNKFHQLQQEAARQRKTGEMDTKVEWSSVGRKRKREKEKGGAGGLIKGLKRRGTMEDKEEETAKGNGEDVEAKQAPKPTPKEPPKNKVPLVIYASDSE